MAIIFINYFNKIKALILIGLITWAVAWAECQCNAVTLRIATYNVRNYGNQNRWLDKRFFKHYPKPEDEKAIVRKVIIGINPDIIALQEIGSEAHLRELQEDLQSEGVIYPYRGFMENNNGGFGTAVLSKIKWDRMVKHLPMIDYMGDRVLTKRGLFQLSFYYEDRCFFLYVVHLKSKLTEDEKDLGSEIFRSAEAAVFGKLILEETIRDKIPFFLVVGDFNATADNASIKTFGGIEPFVRLPADDETGESWTYFYARENKHTEVDFVFCSEAMQEYVSGRKARISGIDKEMKGSDHRLVYVDIF